MGDVIIAIIIITLIFILAGGMYCYGVAADVLRTKREIDAEMGKLINNKFTGATVTDCTDDQKVKSLFCDYKKLVDVYDKIGPFKATKLGGEAYLMLTKIVLTGTKNSNIKFFSITKMDWTFYGLVFFGGLIIYANKYDRVMWEVIFPMLIASDELHIECSPDGVVKTTMVRFNDTSTSAYYSYCIKIGEEDGKCQKVVKDQLDSLCKVFPSLLARKAFSKAEKVEIEEKTLVVESKKYTQLISSIDIASILEDMDSIGFKMMHLLMASGYILTFGFGGLLINVTFNLIPEIEKIRTELYDFQDKHLQLVTIPVGEESQLVITTKDGYVITPAIHMMYKKPNWRKWVAMQFHHLLWKIYKDEDEG